jgi:trimeric autotransporter adhesin
MRIRPMFLFPLFVIVCSAATLLAQQTEISSAASNSVASPVPRLIKFSGTLLDEQGHPLKGPVGVTFSLYAQQSGGAALWMETQNVELDASGNYTALLGSASANGIAEELFASGEARWLGVQAERQLEQPRALLVSVPYALKAGDAQTLGGLPASAFAPAGTPSAAASSPSSTTNILTTTTQPATTTLASISGTGTTNFVPLWTSSTNLGNSILFQSASSSIGIGTTAPVTKLDVAGGANIRGQLSLPRTGLATSTLGFNSQPLDFLASAFNSTSGVGAVNQHFRWQAEPVGNDTTTPSGKLNLLFATGTSTPAETGLSISNKGIITFAPGQTLPTVTGNETVNGNFTATGSVSGASAKFTGNITTNSNGIAIQGNASGNAFTTVGVSGTATGSSGIGVEGTSLSTTGSGIGVKGLSNSTSGVAGLFQNFAGGLLLQGLNRFGTATVFDVDSNGNLGTAGSISAAVGMFANFASFAGNSKSTLIGDPGCGPGFAGIGFGALSGCTNYSLIGDGTNTYINAGSFGFIHFREGNATEPMTISNTGRVGIGTTSPHTTLDVNGDVNASGAISGTNAVAGGIGVFGSAPNGFGMATDSNAQQARAMGGWVKAMVHVDSSKILSCYNSQASGPAVFTPPCGFTLDPFGSRIGDHEVDFGFQVSDRFVLLTVTNSGDTQPDSSPPGACVGCGSNPGHLTGEIENDTLISPLGTIVRVLTYYTDNSTSLTNTGFYLIIF